MSKQCIKGKRMSNKESKIFFLMEQLRAEARLEAVMDILCKQI